MGARKSARHLQKYRCMRPNDTQPHMNEAVNRLAAEKSPYLLQHAHQPVAWYPWGPEAFSEAERTDKPIFLSVGYAACHWCHVMSHESFEDIETAAMLNEAFVCIKVDREERPDVDHVYMEVCQRMTGSGGWPLTVLLTPDKKPFFAATYLPKQQQFGRRGLREIVPEVQNLWRRDRAKVLRAAESVSAAIQSQENQKFESPTDSATDLPGPDAMHLAHAQLEQMFDSVHAGFGNGTKFPSPHQLSFLLRYHARFQNSTALEMVSSTLHAMRNGGLYDHVGFGFHRYAVDPAWHVPHFEKMLYDQAMLLIAYTEAYRATGTASFRDTAAEIAAYVLRDLRDDGGAFHASEDADSEGEEGRFYTWSEIEVRRLLNDDADTTCRAFDIRPGGNYTDPHTDTGGRNVFDLTGPSDEGFAAVWPAARPC